MYLCLGDAFVLIFQVNWITVIILKFNCLLSVIFALFPQSVRNDIAMTFLIDELGLDALDVSVKNRLLDIFTILGLNWPPISLANIRLIWIFDLVIVSDALLLRYYEFNLWNKFWYSFLSLILSLEAFTFFARDLFISAKLWSYLCLLLICGWSKQHPCNVLMLFFRHLLIFCGFRWIGGLGLVLLERSAWLFQRILLGLARKVMALLGGVHMLSIFFVISVEERVNLMQSWTVSLLVMLSFRI